MRGFSRRVSATVLAGVVACSFTVLSGASVAVPPEADIVDVGLSGYGDVLHVRSGGIGVEPGAATEAAPARIVVSYSHDGRTASDPAVIDGKSGRVRIDVGVFNTTGRVENVAGDVNGHSVSAARWVSTPLSVAGAVRLEGIDPSAVVTAGAVGAVEDTTNGVVGVDQDGVTTVQWADLTGLGADEARFSLVVDAKDFVVPTIDVLVQPGFGIALNAEEQRSQSELVAKTLKTLGDAGKVLADSSKALGEARTLLTGASDQIGVKTIADLNASNGRVAMSASQIASTLSAIDAEASAMLSATSSQVAQQLSATTNVVKGLLGDPSAPAPTVVVDPGTCTLEVPSQNEDHAGSNDTSVIAVVRGLSMRLNALAESSSRCQQLLLGDVDALLGPAEPSAHRCSDNDGLTCRLWQANENMTALIDHSYREGLELVDDLKNGSDESAMRALATLGKRLDDVEHGIRHVRQVHSNSDLVKQVALLRATINDLDAPINHLESVFDAAADRVGRIGDISEHQDRKITDIKRLVCVASGLTESSDEKLTAEAYKIGRDAAKDLVRLVSDTSCPAKDPGDGNSVDGDLPSGSRDSLQALGKRARKEIVGISEDIAPTQGGANVPKGRKALDDLRDTVAEVGQTLDDLVQSNAQRDETTDNAITTLEQAYVAARSAFSDVEADTRLFAGHVSQAAASLNRHVENSHRRASLTMAGQQPVLLDSVETTRQRVEDTSEQVFANFSDQLGKESKTLLSNTTAAVRSTNRGVDQANSELALTTSRLLEQNTAGIHGMVSDAIVDAQATSGLLADDIARVLADIGTNTNKGQGLLGAIATSQAHLGVTDTKLADSTTHMAHTQFQQREAQSGLVLDDAAMRLSLSRVEQLDNRPSTNTNGHAGWFSFHVRMEEER